MKTYSRIKPENLTPHFRNLMREENPTWTTADFFRWSWRDDKPLFDKKPIDNLREMIGRGFPGSQAIEKMYCHIREEHRELIFKTGFYF